MDPWKQTYLHHSETTHANKFQEIVHPEIIVYSGNFYSLNIYSHGFWNHDLISYMEHKKYYLKQKVWNKLLR